MKYFSGIDIGSRTGKLVIVDEAKKKVFSTIRETRKTAFHTFRLLLEEIPALLKESIAFSVGTGYGRVAIEKDVDDTATEITCHFLGAYEIERSLRTVIDIGGQDSKVIVVRDGIIHDFAMNDRCAAGTGRFLEVMVDRLDFSFEEFSKLDISHVETVPINATCTVFAESEVVSLMATTENSVSIASSVAKMVAQNLFFILKRMHSSPPYIMTGGVSKVRPVVQHLEKMTGSRIVVNKDSQIAGAYGAALLALKKFGEKDA